MSDWENDDEPVKVVPAFGARRKFEDEDAEDEIKDDWEEDDEEPVKAPAAPAPTKKKGSVKQKIAEKEAEERRRAELGLGSDEDGLDSEEEEDPVERRRKEREAQIQADVANAASLLGTARIGDDALSKLRSANPTSKEDWEAFASSLFTELIKKHTSRPGYDKHFAPALVREIAEPLRDVDMRKMSVKLKEQAEDKVKREKEAKKLGGNKAAAAKAKPKPKSVGTASAKNTIDTSAYGDEAMDDDLDFM